MKKIMYIILALIIFLMGCNKHFVFKPEFKLGEKIVIISDGKNGYELKDMKFGKILWVGKHRPQYLYKIQINDTETIYVYEKQIIKDKGYNINAN